MTTQTFSHVTLQSLENYRAAANHTVVAYRVGSHRIVDAVNGALKNSVYPRTAKLAPRATDRMDDVRGSMTQIMVKGINQVAEQAERAIEMGSTAATTQFNKVVDFATGIDNPMFANGLQTAARVSMPGAKLALALSGRVADGAQALADVAGTAGSRLSPAAVEKKVVKTARKAASRAKSAVAPVAPTVRRAKAQIDATVKSTLNSTAKAGNKTVSKLAKAVEAPMAQVKTAARRAKKTGAKAMAA